MTDYRVINRCTYSIEAILFIALCSTLSGGKDFRDMEEFATQRIRWLQKFVQLPDRVPVSDTFERVFQQIDPDQFRKALLNITRQNKEALQEDIIAIDGKKLRGASPNTRGNKGIFMLTAWAAYSEHVVQGLRIENKSNEISGIPKLLEKITLESCTVSIDAIGCQRKIAKQIVEQQADYILAVKANQPSLLEEIQEVFNYAQSNNYDNQEDYGHGRYENRCCKVLDAKEFLSPDQLSKWESVNSLVEIESLREKGNVKTTSSRYYISSHEKLASYFNKAIRSHWSIENKLHWNLDMVLHEDENRSQKKHAPENLNILRKLTLRFLKQKKDKKSKRKRQFAAALSTDYLEELLSVNI